MVRIPPADCCSPGIKPNSSCEEHNGFPFAKLPAFLVSEVCDVSWVAHISSSQQLIDRAPYLHSRCRLAGCIVHSPRIKASPTKYAQLPRLDSKIRETWANVTDLCRQWKRRSVTANGQWMPWRAFAMKIGQSIPAFTVTGRRLTLPKGPYQTRQWEIFASNMRLIAKFV